MEVKGRDLSAGLPKTLTIRSEEIREALQEPLSSILESVRITLERCPPELSADLVDRGIVMAGGGALLRGIDRLVAEETGLPVHIADDPLTAVANGTDAATKLSAEAQRSFADAAKRIEKVVQDGLEQLRAQSRAYADTAGQQLDEAQRYVTERVKERPLAAAGAALGVGVLIGLLLASSRRH